MHVLINYDWPSRWRRASFHTINGGLCCCCLWRKRSQTSNDRRCSSCSTYMGKNIQLSRSVVEKQKSTGTHTHDKYTNRRYLYSLAIVDFNYVEVKTVNSFPWCNEVTSLFVKIPPNIYKNLKDRQTERNSLVQALCHAVRNTTATNSKYFYFKTDLTRKQTNLCCPLGENGFLYSQMLHPEFLLLFIWCGID